jgi:FAD/FMN-containing dehydrogenase
MRADTPVQAQPEKIMKEKVGKQLSQIVGPEHVIHDEDKLSAYFRGSLPPVPLVAVAPKDAEEIIELVLFASKENVPLFTLKDSHFPEPFPESGGVIVDFKRMSAIEGVDKRNLTVRIQRGVTWGRLREELDRQGLKTLMPAAATSPYVLDNMVSRVIMRSAARYPEVQVSNLKVVLADGRVHLTGSHALAEDGCDSKDDGGPNLSRWYIGAEDIFGIPVQGTIWVYPVPAADTYLFFGYDELALALTAIRNIPRKEVCDQALVMSNRYLRRLAPDVSDDAPPWVVLLGCEGDPRHVEYQAGVCRQDAMGLGGRELPGLHESLGASLHTVWIRPEHSHGFYTFLSRASEFHDLVSAKAGGSMAELFVSHGYGRAAWCEFDYLEPLEDNLESTYEAVNDLLVEEGAYFDRPLGRAAERFYAGNMAYLDQVRKVKHMMDPKRILNPDQLVKGV